MPPTTRQPTASATTTSGSKLPEAIQAQFDGARASLDDGHTMPNLAALTIAVRKSKGGLSQMSLGKNRVGSTNEKVFADAQTPMDLPSGSKGHLNSGWFSLIANIEQGGRKTTIPEEFVVYLAKVSGVSQARVKELVAEDTKVATALAEAAKSKTTTPANS